MTHEELLARIGTPLDEGYQYVDIMYMKAIRAVVELHKPAWWNSRDTDIKEAYCAGCENRCGCYEGDILSYNTWETCPTIQAIEKALI